MIFKKRNWVASFVLGFFLFPAAVFAGVIEGFTARDDVINFNIEGVSVLTPLTDVEAILANHGWTLLPAKKTSGITPPHVTLTFAKGDYANGYRGMYNPTPGGVMYMIEFTSHDSGVKSIVLTRRGAAVAAADAIDRPYAMALRKIICSNIPHKNQHKTWCIPAKPDDLFLGQNENGSIHLSTIDQLNAQTFSHETLAKIQILHGPFSGR